MKPSDKYDSPQFGDMAWDQMSDLLDQKMPTDTGSRYRHLWWVLVMSMSVLCLSSTSSLKHTDHMAAVTSQTAAQVEPQSIMLADPSLQSSPQTEADATDIYTTESTSEFASRSTSGFDKDASASEVANSQSKRKELNTSSSPGSLALASKSDSESPAPIIGVDVQATNMYGQEANQESGLAAALAGNETSSLPELPSTSAGAPVLPSDVLSEVSRVTDELPAIAMIDQELSIELPTPSVEPSVVSAAHPVKPHNWYASVMGIRDFGFANHGVSLELGRRQSLSPKSAITAGLRYTYLSTTPLGSIQNDLNSFSSPEMDVIIDLENLPDESMDNSITSQNTDPAPFLNLVTRYHLLEAPIQYRRRISPRVELHSGLAVSYLFSARVPYELVDGSGAANTANRLIANRANNLDFFSQYPVLSRWDLSALAGASYRVTPAISLTAQYQQGLTPAARNGSLALSRKSLSAGVTCQF